MRIACPFCGERSYAEFTYLGDAAPVRPEGGTGAAPDFFDYVYLRSNPPGRLREWWQHTGGCRAWLAVERNVTTHEIIGVSAPQNGARIAQNRAEEMFR